MPGYTAGRLNAHQVEAVEALLTDFTDRKLEPAAAAAIDRAMAAIAALADEVASVRHGKEKLSNLFRELRQEFERLLSGDHRLPD